MTGTYSLLLLLIFHLRNHRDVPVRPDGFHAGPVRVAAEAVRCATAINRPQTTGEEHVLLTVDEDQGR